MAVVNGYATTEEAKTWIGLTDNLDDLTLDDIVTAVSRWIDQYCRRHFWQTAAGVTRTFDTDDSQRVEFGPFNDLVSATAVKTDDNEDGTYETTWAASDYQLIATSTSSGPEARPYRQLRSTGTRWFPMPNRRVELVQVTGTWGWPAVPQSVSQACRMQTSRILQRRKSPEGVSGWGEFGPMRISARLDPDVKDLLIGYRLPLVR